MSDSKYEIYGVTSSGETFYFFDIIRFAIEQKQKAVEWDPYTFHENCTTSVIIYLHSGDSIEINDLFYLRVFPHESIPDGLVYCDPDMMPGEGCTVYLESIKDLLNADPPEQSVSKTLEDATVPELLSAAKEKIKQRKE